MNTAVAHTTSKVHQYATIVRSFAARRWSISQAGSILSDFSVSSLDTVRMYLRGGYSKPYERRETANSMAVKSAISAFEFSASPTRVGWRSGKPVWIAFSLKSTREIYEDSPSSIVICVVPPHAVVVECLEQAIQFFSGDDVALLASDFVFAY